MALVLGPADSVYSQLPSFEMAVDKFNAQLSSALREEVLLSCKDLLFKHGLEDTVGIDLKHTHFGMPDGHVLAEVQEHSKLESRMWPQAFDPSLTPFAWAWIDGIWQPYEFVANCDEAKLGLVELQQKPDFLLELAAVLSESNVQDILGFHVLHRTFLSGQGGTMETPGEHPDELLLRPNTPELQRELSEAEEQTQKVMWTWGKGTCADGNCTFHGGTSNSCSSHCKGHRK